MSDIVELADECRLNLINKTWEIKHPFRKTNIEREIFIVFFVFLGPSLVSNLE